MKKILILILVSLAVVGGIYWFMMPKDGIQIPSNNEGQVLEDPDFPGKADPSQASKPETFSGTLEKVDTGCFADGECYAVVEGKHVTVLMGRMMNPQIVGQILGVPTIGDLETKIGSEFEVYALKKPDGTYTLHGNENFYIKLKQ